MRAQAFSNSCGRSRSGRAFGPIWIRGTPCVCAQPPRTGMFRGSMGRMASSFSFYMKEPMVLSELVEFGPFIPAETVKACALVCLHMMAEENAFRSNSDSPDFGDMWMYDCPKSSVWSSGGINWAGSESTSSFEEYEQNVESLALEVIGQNWRGEMVSLFLEDWEVGRVALSCHMAMDLLCLEMRDAFWVSSKSRVSPLSPCSQCQSSSLVELSQHESPSLTMDGL